MSWSRKKGFTHGKIITDGKLTFKCPICGENHYYDSDIGKQHTNLANTRARNKLQSGLKVGATKMAIPGTAMEEKTKAILFKDYNDAKFQVSELLKDIKYFMDEAAPKDQSKLNWGHVGSLNHMIEELTNIKKFISNTQE